MNMLLTPLIVAATLGSALMAGTFFAFSNFIMAALGSTTAPYGIEAMQRINRTVLNPGFLGSFMGTALLGVALIALAVWRWQQPGSGYLITASAFYVVGTFGVTAAFNVPLNDALEAVEAGSDKAAELWNHYLSRWTFWNHVRTVAAMIATALFALALR